MRRPRVLLLALLAFVSIVLSTPMCVDDSIASMLCSPFGPAPRIALCLSGAARTFEHKLVHRSIKENVLERLGAPVTTFAFLKLGDARSDSRSEYGATIEATEAGVRRTARVLRVARLELKNASHNAPPQCSNYPTYRSREECPECHKGGTAHQQSILGQLEGRAKCFEMLSAHEERENRTFDWVLVARPDLTWWDAVAPWCRHTLPKRLNDWTFWLSRSDAAKQLRDPWVDHYACKTPPRTDKPIEDFITQHTDLRRYRHSPVSLPAVLTRVVGRGFPLNIDAECTERMLKCGADKAIAASEHRCVDETSGNVCNAPHSYEYN